MDNWFGKKCYQLFGTHASQPAETEAHDYAGQLKGESI